MPELDDDRYDAEIQRLTLRFAVAVHDADLAQQFATQPCLPRARASAVWWAISR